MLANAEFKKDLFKYVTGFVLSLVLTVAAFAAVLLLSLSPTQGVLVAGMLGVVQLVIQLKYFLHIDMSPDARDKLHLLIFSMVILLVIVIGTVWIMADLGGRMMHPM